MCFSSPRSDEEERSLPANHENNEQLTVQTTKSSETLDIQDNKPIDKEILSEPNSSSQDEPFNKSVDNEGECITELVKENKPLDKESLSEPNSSSQDESLNKSVDNEECTAELVKSCDSSIASETETDDKNKSNMLCLTSGVSESKITPKKTLSPKQAQKRKEIEKRREEQQKEREVKKQQLLEEKLKIKQEKEKLKLEKHEQKQKEIEEKQKEKEEKKKKEREEKEQKRKEKEEKIEQKRKEKEEKNEQKRKEQEEKNKEKQKLEEKKQKAAAAFANFFTKKTDSSIDDKKSEDDFSLTFMPFEVKSDMRLAPVIRIQLTDDQKEYLDLALQNQNDKTYLIELKEGKKIGKDCKTWLSAEPEDLDDVIIVEDMNPGERIEEQPKDNNKHRAKFLKFADNRRPAYFGTWRKKSKLIKPRKPLALDKEYFDYEYDSDEDWEDDEDTGESLHGSDEDKENDSDNEYEVDNEFFVPHGHLSDDEVNDEEDAVVSPEAHKAKLKLLKKEFEEEMQGKTQKIKSRVIGCIWYNKERDNVENAIHEFLKPFSIISNGSITIKKRNEFVMQTPLRSFQPGKPLPIDLIPEFLTLIHGNTNNSNKVITEFLNCLRLRHSTIEVSKASLKKQWKKFADWIKCPEVGPMLNKYCWYVRNEVKEEYNIDLKLPNKV